MLLQIFPSSGTRIFGELNRHLSEQASPPQSVFRSTNRSNAIDDCATFEKMLLWSCTSLEASSTFASTLSSLSSLSSSILITLKFSVGLKSFYTLCSHQLRRLGNNFLLNICSNGCFDEFGFFIGHDRANPFVGANSFLKNFTFN